MVYCGQKDNKVTVWDSEKWEQVGEIQIANTPKKMLLVEEDELMIAEASGYIEIV